MQPLDAYLNQVVWALISALPWLLGIALGGGLIAWSPLGKLLVRYLQDRGRNDTLLEANNAELAEVGRALGAMTERLDATERLLLQLAQGERAPMSLPRPAPDVLSEVSTPTPH